MRRVLSVLLAVGISCISAKAENPCDTVMKYGAREYTEEIQKYSLLKRTHDEFCEGSSFKSSQSSNFGLDAIIKAIPIKFSMGSGSAQEKMSHFCRTFNDELSENSERYRATNLVSTAAIEAWRSCMALYGQGVEFRPTITPTKVAIAVEKKAAGSVLVQKVEVDSAKLQCTVTDADGQSGNNVQLTANTQKSLNGDHVWNIICTRTPQETGAERHFPPTDLIVATSKSNFTLLIPGDTEFGIETANQLGAKLIALTSETEALRTALAKKVSQCRVCYNWAGTGDILRCDVNGVRGSGVECTHWSLPVQGDRSEFVNLIANGNCSLAWRVECRP